MMAKTINCPCGFSVTTESDDELVKHVQLHAKDIHNMSPSRDEVLAMAQPK
jgi:predicted small metal-binding protein